MKYDELQNRLEFVQAKLDEAERRLTEYESHRYSLFSGGVRTFRVDSIIGGTCIQLTTESDWKKKDVQAESCDCRDYIAGKLGEPNPDTRKMICGF